MQVGTRAARARAMADRDFRAAARRLREAGVRGDRSACEPEAWARKEGSQPGAEEDEAVHPRSDRPGRRARRKRSQVQIAPGDRAPFFASESGGARSEEHTSELQSQSNLVCRLLLEKKKIYRYLLRLMSNLTSFLPRNSGNGPLRPAAACPMSCPLTSWISSS